MKCETRHQTVYKIKSVTICMNYIIRGEYGHQTSNVVEQVTGQKPRSFGQFVNDYSRYFS